MSKKKRKRKNKRTHQKIVKIPNGVIDQILQDVKNNGVRFYAFDEVPPVFIHKDLIHPKLFDKCIGATVAVSGCCADNRNYMYLGGIRIDKEKGQNVTDFDPVVLVSNIETGSQAPSGVVTFHADYEGRTEPLGSKLVDVSLDELKKELNGKELSFDEAPERLKNAMHYSAQVYRNELDKEPDGKEWMALIPSISLEALMATMLDPKQMVSFEELLMSQVIAQEALTRLLVEKGILTKEEFLEMVKAVDRERKRTSK